MKTLHSFVARSIVTGMTAWGAGSYEARAQGRSAGGGQRSPGASPFRPATQPRAAQPPGLRRPLPGPSSPKPAPQFLQPAPGPTGPGPWRRWPHCGPLYPRWYLSGSVPSWGGPPAASVGTPPAVSPSEGLSGAADLIRAYGDLLGKSQEAVLTRDPCFDRSNP